MSILTRLVRWIDRVNEKHRIYYEKQKAIQSKIEEEATLIRLLNERIDELDRFSGNLMEYNSFKGKTYQIMDTGVPEKEVFVDNPSSYPWNGREKFDTENLAKLLDNGCEGFIYYNLRQGWKSVYYSDGKTTYTNYQGFGVPVRRKEGKNE
jgi:hypothetical protein